MNHTDHELTREDCLTLVASTSLGRLIYTEGALPAVQPVRYLLDGETIVFRTADATRILGHHDGPGEGTVVAFEVDDLDAESGAGWVVTVVGTASTLHPDHAHRYCPQTLRPLTAPALADAGHCDVIAVAAGIIRGRRLIG